MFPSCQVSTPFTYSAEKSILLVMVRVHASSAVDRGFEFWSGQSKHY